ncbi:putative [histone H3]-lysine(4) N-trimethyltransferase [Helianthus annuus]|uniref:Histone-lysine N-methyltransferase n=1 Tax=Helianthus annuus TaxID=4232 RepID=A0A251UQ11_HELAN|nr:YDG domain-containing protein At5g47150 [Helianthus annuus]KAF5805603.1 putative histone-lysine N-methyltransferase [Helianthus annuus]KAJ0570011.1 putative [histone H3]-lysine(4) N-trimethyltransferase [Helianthus annuus]KAJ0576712.1 putative [histone H3]-lysine(4) N-trimethyltransferase [Helianthus annuus]KAJ0584341.1 putative [histone H3]-lysine(4) N-trimethyltransferase [Helianthus annuus]KAJ0746971.1 putative [histone H3]-lysine(4) N-trimethyltransferase [Helianthus annuus]
MELPRKRASDDFNDRDLEAGRRQKPKVLAVRDFPPGCGINEADIKPLKKLRNVHLHLEAVRKQKPKVLAVRDFPPGCGVKEADIKPLKKLRNVHLHLENNSLKPNEFFEKSKVTNTVVTERKPLKLLDNEDTNTGKTNLRMKDKAVSIEHAEFRRNKPSFGLKPAGKVMFWDPTCTNEGHDQQPKVTTTTVSRGKPLKSSDNGDSNVTKLTSNGEDKRFQPKERSRNKSSFGSKEGDAQKSDVSTTSGTRKEHTKREKIKEAMSVFDEVYAKLLQDNRLKSKEEKIANWRVPVEVAKIAKQMLKWMEPEKSLGHICGVQIGDKFKFRSQLKMIGLHCQLQSGIDYTNIEGKNLAISVVDAHRYSNESGSSDMLIYSGHGGLGFLGCKLPPEDQKLVRGNLALKNSMDERTPVRVIRKVEGFQKNELFVYDGLYVVNHYTQNRNEEGKIAFQFHLSRVPGQPLLHKMLNASC